MNATCVGDELYFSHFLLLDDSQTQMYFKYHSWMVVIVLLIHVHVCIFYNTFLRDVASL